MKTLNIIRNIASHITPLSSRWRGIVGETLICLLFLTACTDDESFSVSRGDVLSLPVDTLCMDTVFSTVPVPTKSFWVFNKAGDGLRCKKVFLEKGNQTGFRVNVDGEFLSPEQGYTLTDVEVRKGDSIRVFVELTSTLQGTDLPNEINDNLVFELESGLMQKVALQAWTWNAEILRDFEVKGNYTLSGKKPILVYGGIKVDSLATLTIQPGTTVYFQHGGGLDVYGKVLSQGTADEPVVLRGARLDRMFDYLPYDSVSGQWSGVHLHSSSMDNRFTYTDIHSTYDGIVCDSSALDRAKLLLYNSTIHNCQGYGLKAEHCVIDVQSSQITNALYDCVCVDGGFTQLINCTLAQFYPFDQSGNRGWALKVTDNTNEDNAVSLVGFNGLNCLNTIVTGYADDVLLQSCNDTINVFNVKYKNSVLRTPAVEDSIMCEKIVWEAELEKQKESEEAVLKTGKDMFRLVDHNLQRYDFHLDTLACAIGAADPDLLPVYDRDGKPFDKSKPDIGCYSLSTSQSESTKSFLRRIKR